MLTSRRRSRRTSAGARRIREEQRLTLPGSDIEFLLQRDGCRTLRLAVRADGSVRLRAPERLPLDRVLDFLLARLDWVKAKRTFFARHRGEVFLPRAGARMTYLGKVFALRPVPAGPHARAALTADALELPCLRPGAGEKENAAALERAFLRWRKNRAGELLGRRLARLESRARDLLGDGAAVHAFTVRSLRRRWGSCSARGDITLAVQLIAMPLPLIDYVICHELCHLRQMNHGPAFHALLHTLLPDARERERRIHIWGLEHPR